MGKFCGSADVYLCLLESADSRHKGAFDKVQTYFSIAEGEGYEIFCGGKSFTLIEFANLVNGSEGYFAEPSIVLSQDPKSRLMTEEIFGPVLTALNHVCNANLRSTFMRTTTGPKS
jgi:hypothetical protein